MTIPGPGETHPGWIVRSAHGLLFLAPGADPAAHPMMALFRRADSPWGLVGQVLSELVESDIADGAPFVMLASTAPEATVITAGRLAVTVDGAPVESLRRVDKVDRRERTGDWTVSHPRSTAVISIGTPPQPWMVTAGSDLRAGLVAASGALVLPGSTALTSAAPPETGPTDASPPETAPTDASPPETAPTDAPPKNTAPTDTAPIDTAPTVAASAKSAYPATNEGSDDADTTVIPVISSRGLEGTEVRAGPELSRRHDTPGPVGILTWDDGRTEPLTGDVILGRAPWAHVRVTAGSAVGIVPDGMVTSLSEVHAELQIDGDTVTLIDRGSTNGTFVWEPGPARWRRLAPGEGQLLDPGTTFAVSERTCTFDLVTRPQEHLGALDR
ncbi:MAG: FHA domain-containing protein [Actinomycetota bacterium]|nr:FHA domain-containing protein [Actinomycetota bacterium]